MIRVAFASSDDAHVDMHFGAAERLIIYDVSRGCAELVGVGEFGKVEMKGENRQITIPEAERTHSLTDRLRQLPLIVKLYRLLFRRRRLVLPDQASPFGEPYAPTRDQVGPPSDRPPEDKVVAKLAFLQGCVAVYAASIGSSSVKRLMSVNIQPIIVDQGHDILDLLNRVNAAIHHGGVAWVDQALAAAVNYPPKQAAANAPEYQEPYRIDPY